MLTRTSVVNNALRRLGAVQISSIDADVEQARQASAVYDNVVRSELEAHCWFFAKKMAKLPASAVAPEYKYALAYPLPNDFIRLVELEGKWAFSTIRGPDANPIPLYDLVGRTLMTDLPAPLTVMYIQDVSADPTVWSPLFVNVVASALALELAMSLTKSQEQVDLCAKRYQSDLDRARKSNAIQRPPQPMPDNSWVLVRG